MVAQRWDGRGWQRLPAGPRTAYLDGVSCTAPSACMAVGYSMTRADEQGLATIWTGRRWKITHPPGPGGRSSPSLAGVSCTSTSRCIAVGSFTNGTGDPQALAERWDGRRWSLQGTENKTVSATTMLSGVSCASPSGCIAVGTLQAGGSDYVSLVDQWSGTPWSTQNAFARPSPANQTWLKSVSCTGPAACTAIGTGDGASAPPLAESWNGADWSVQRLPSPDAYGAYLESVSCASPAACTARRLVPALRLLAVGR
jgi:hypothetical protein